MDKRSLFAIVLTIAVLFAWNYFYIGPKQKELAERRRLELREQAAADSLAALEEQADQIETEVKDVVIKLVENKIGSLK